MESGKMQSQLYTKVSCSALVPYRFLFFLFDLILFSLLFLFFSLIFCVQSSKAQYSFSRWDSIPVKIDSALLLNPWAGGLNFPQLSSIDLDGNGIEDLFIFDRSGLNGKKNLTFINKNIPDSSAFVHAPQFENKFPSITGWALLTDYDYDGKKDLFSANPGGGVRVYKNEFSLAEGLKFQLQDSLLKADIGPQKVEIYVSPWDIPAIEDIDNDGDLDMLSFYVGGSAVTYYKNISMENYGNPDSLEFQVNDACWGKFIEWTENCNDSLGITCKGSFPIADSLNAKHAGSTLLALDLDGDNDKELIVGDLVCNFLTQLTNGGDLNSAYMTEANTQYPSAFPVKIAQFPGSFWVDIDNDNLKDLVVAPSATNISENFTSVWMYKNTGSNDVPQFEFKTKSFLQNTMIETGEGANVAFFDADADSLQDMVIGNSGYYKPGISYLSELSLYKNTGSKTNPSYELVTRDYAGVSTLGLTDVYPCFGDIDGDGDKDMILGETTGQLFLFTDGAGPENPASFSLTGPGYKGIDVGQFSAPQLVDINRDGLLDLLIGERNGNLNYYKNTGTVTGAEFILENDSFGNVHIRETGAVTGYSVPRLVELDTIPQYSLLVGTESGKIFLYQNIDNNLDGSFSLTDSMFMDIYEGIRATVDAVDITNDRNPDLIVGNYRGGLAIYKNNALPQPEKPSLDTFSQAFFPNPAKDNFHVNIPAITTGAEIFLFNLMGKRVYYGQITNPGRYIINVRNFASGIYYCQVILDGTTVFKQKVVFIK